MTDDGFIPLSAPHLKGNELKYLTDCIETGWVSSAGPYVTRFEAMIADILGVPHAVSCVNGTSALHLSLLLAGTGPEDEVIVPTITFIAPVNTIRYVGAHPVFMDCDNFLNLDPQKFEDFLKRECERTPNGLKNKTSGRHISAVIPVHVFGHPADMDAIVSLAEHYELTVIEDATESIGSRFTEGKSAPKHAGTIGLLGCLSFNGNKLITTGGGGMIVTRNRTLAERARHLSTQAKSDPLYSRHDAVGYNYRMTNLQAAVGVAQLEQLDRFLEIKRRSFEKYREALTPLGDEVRLITEPAYARSNFWHYALVTRRRPGRPIRDSLMEEFRKNHIESRPLWHPVHLQNPYLSFQSYRIEKATVFAEEVLNLPCSISLTDAQIEKVSGIVRSYYGQH